VTVVKLILVAGIHKNDQAFLIPGVVQVFRGLRLADGLQALVLEALVRVGDINLLISPRGGRHGARDFQRRNGLIRPARKIISPQFQSARRNLIRGERQSRGGQNDHYSFDQNFRHRGSSQAHTITDALVAQAPLGPVAGRTALPLIDS